MLQNAINAARVKAKNALALLYVDACTIYANMPVLEDATGITEYQESALLERVPCRISFGSAASAAADAEKPARACLGAWSRNLPGRRRRRTALSSEALSTMRQPRAI